MATSRQLIIILFFNFQFAKSVAKDHQDAENTSSTLGRYTLASHAFQG